MRPTRMNGLTVECDGCGEWVDEPGGLLFSPPDAAGLVRKHHLCIGCWAVVPSLLGRLATQGTPERILAETFARLSDEPQAQFFIEVAAVAAEWPRPDHGVAIDQWYLVGRHLATCACSTDDARSLVQSIAAGIEAGERQILLGTQ